MINLNVEIIHQIGLIVMCMKNYSFLTLIYLKTRNKFPRIPALESRNLQGLFSKNYFFVKNFNQVFHKLIKFLTFRRPKGLLIWS